MAGGDGQDLEGPPLGAVSLKRFQSAKPTRSGPEVPGGASRLEGEWHRGKELAPRRVEVVGVLVMGQDNRVERAEILGSEGGALGLGQGSPGALSCARAG